MRYFSVLLVHLQLVHVIHVLHEQFGVDALAQPQGLVSFDLCVVELHRLDDLERADGEQLAVLEAHILDHLPFVVGAPQSTSTQHDR